MAKLVYVIDSNGPRNLKLEWDGGWFYVRNNLNVYLDNELLGTIPNPDDLRLGWDRKLSGKDILQIKLDGNYFHRIIVTLNGKDIAKVIHPQAIWKEAYQFLFYAGTINIFIGLWELMRPYPDDYIPMSIFNRLLSDLKLKSYQFMVGSTLFLGFIFLLLGFLAKGKQVIAFLFGLILFVFQLMVYFFYGELSLDYVLFFGMAIIVMSKGLKALFALRDFRQIS